MSPAMDLPSPDPRFFDRVLAPALRPLERYHRHEAVGLQHVPARGPALLISSHSLVTYDIFLAVAAVRRHTGRIARALADDLWFRVPVVAEIFRRAGLVPASPDAGRLLLARGELLGVAPGGQWEALRPASERFSLRWGTRSGFARLALAGGAPVVLVTCPAADLAVTAYANPLTDLVYRRLRAPLPIFRGIGPTPIPRPVRLRTHFSPPLRPPPPRGAVATDDEVEAFRAELHARMVAFIAEVRARDGLGDPRSDDRSRA
jgi:1-acyl-sn-glycerol-3-phosphate acyltransferase